MDRWGWVAVRAYTPAGFALLFAVASDAMLSDLANSPLLSGFLSVGRWVPLLALAIALGLLIIPTYRLIQWQRGAGLYCPHCNGPLGSEHIGYARMGGPYRRCYSCGNNVNHRHYE